jgi:hypothetical protein
LIDLRASLVNKWVEYTWVRVGVRVRVGVKVRVRVRVIVRVRALIR